jgi:hypothetical protein
VILPPLVFPGWSVCVGQVFKVKVYLELAHGQTLANRTKLFSAIGVGVHTDKYMHNFKTASLIVENLAQTRFRLSPISFRAPQNQCYCQLRGWEQWLVPLTCPLW